MKVYKELEDGIRIVEYEDSLAGALVEMWRLSEDSWGGDNELRTAESIKAEHAGGAFFNVFVAMKGDEAVGYCSFDRYYKDADTSYVHLLNVRPDYHGKRVGKELVLQCVNKTIQMGYPRVDIHTWAGNTKAVPLYKKCGFLWEDRADSTHLQNQIPTVLKTELFADFFKTADWYDDSVRTIEVKPDGVKQNGFEMFGYAWEKDGQALRVGFERTGRRVRLVETNDYRIEMTAENHELAFGLSYKCRFEVVNKSGAPLSVTIEGKSDGVIAFDYHDAAEVADTQVFDAAFTVGAIEREQDIWRVHPCVLADVSVNGLKAEFGLGIEPRFPLKVSLVEKRLIPRIGASEDVYINMQSALPEDAHVTFTMPENPLLGFQMSDVSADVGARKRACVKTKALVTGFGFAELPIEYDITLGDGRRVRFTKPLYVINQGAGAAFAFENDNEYGAVNGFWKLQFNKNNNNASFSKVIGGDCFYFPVTRLGKPYDDEFNLIAPSATRFDMKGGMAVFEADFASLKYEGAVLTELFSFDAGGMLEYRVRVSNTSDRAQSLFAKSDTFFSDAPRAAYHYDGATHGVGDNLAYGFSNIVEDKLDERWIFNADPMNPSGIIWPPCAKATPHWGDGLLLEFETGELSSGGCFETEPVVIVCGVIRDAHDFRNYALGIFEREHERAHNHLELEINAFNPVITGGAAKLTVKNHRPRLMEGSVELKTSENAFDAVSASTPSGAMWDEVSLPIALKKGFSGIARADVSMRISSFERDASRALFVPGDKPVSSVKNGATVTVNNGVLSFSASEDYGGVLHALNYQGREWLYSSYPAREPYAWWNPFVGGMATWLPNMNASLALREECAARPVEVKDCFGNAWTGVVATVSIEQFDEHRGLSYDQYYLTLPGLPVVCCFVKLNNASGEYRELSMRSEAFLCGKRGLSSVHVAYADDGGTEYRMRAGRDGFEVKAGTLAAVSREGEDARPEILHIFGDHTHGGGIGVFSDVNSCSFGTTLRVSAAHGESCSAKPLFLVFSEERMKGEALCDLSRIRF